MANIKKLMALIEDLLETMIIQQETLSLFSAEIERQQKQIDRLSKDMKKMSYN